MRNFLTIAIAFVLLSVHSASGIGAPPDKTILSNKFIQLESSNPFIWGLEREGLTVFQIDLENQELIEIKHLVLSSPVLEMKRGKKGFVIKHENNDLTFIALNSNGYIEEIGQVTPPVDYSDFEVVAGKLYLSRWFDGIDQYEIEDYNSLSFLKNDKSGVLMTRLQFVGGNLFALDMYNGVIRYDLSAEFGLLLTKLFLFQRPFNLHAFGDVVFTNRNSGGVTIGGFYEDSAQVIGEIVEIPGPKRVLIQLSPFVFVSERQLDIIDVFSWVRLGGFPIDSVGINGTILEDGPRKYILLPNTYGGISSYNLTAPYVKRELLGRPGPINSALIHESRLFTGGERNPLEFYGIEDDSLIPPVLLRDEMTGVSDLAINGNRLFALYAKEKRVVSFDLSDMDNIFPSDSFLISIDNAQRLLVRDTLLLVIGKNQIESSANIWNFDNPIVDAAIIGNRLFVTNSFGTIPAFEILNESSLSLCAERDLTGTGWAMEPYNNDLFVFVGNTMTVFSDCLVLDTIVRLPYFVLNTEVKRDTLYTVGPNGIAKYDLSSGLPELVDAGGLSGSHISADGNTIATTDGSSIHLYFENSEIEIEEPMEILPTRTILFDNFPEPFNSSTNIQFDIPNTAEIEISVYSLLGRKIRTLTDRTYEAGRYIISWNGRDESGNEVASGVYFYRLQMTGAVYSKKMLLIK